MSLQVVTDIVGVWLAAFLTLAIFSFLFKDNPLYKFAEHLVVGVSAGYTGIVLYESSFLDLVYDPLKADLTNGGPFASMDRFGKFLIDLIPFILGLMMWTRVSRKASWMGRLPLALFLGVGSGLAIPTYLQTNVVQPVRATIIPIVPTSWSAGLAAVFGSSPEPGGASIGLWGAFCNLVIVGGTFCGIVYFFFSKEHTGITGKAATLGIWVLMIGFGSTFGYTVMSRVSLLVGRIEFLLHTWLQDNLWRFIFPG